MALWCGIGSVCGKSILGNGFITTGIILPSMRWKNNSLPVYRVARYTGNWLLFSYFLDSS